jgi:hypothetical protein
MTLDRKLINLVVMSFVSRKQKENILTMITCIISALGDLINLFSHHQLEILGELLPYGMGTYFLASVLVCPDFRSLWN